MDGIDARLFGPWLQGDLSPLETFQKKLQIVKAPQHGSTWNGPELNKVMENLDLLEELLPESLSQFVYAFKAVKDYYTSICGTTLDENYKSVIAKFSKEWDLVHKQHNISKTPKVIYGSARHIIFSLLCENGLKIGF